jgi:preprotein translocase SecF subunit
MSYKFDFLKKSKITIGISLLLIVLGIAAIILKGGFKLGIDFAGGTALNLNFPQGTDISPAKIRQAMNAYNITGEVTTSRSIGSAADNSFYITLRDFKVNYKGQKVASADMFLFEIFKRYDNVYVDPVFTAKNALVLNVKKEGLLTIDKLVSILEPTEDETRTMNEQSRTLSSSRTADFTSLAVPDGVDAASEKKFKTRLLEGRIYKLSDGKGFKIQVAFASTADALDKKSSLSRFKSLVFEKLTLNNISKVKIEGRQYIGAKIGKYFIRVSIQVIVLVSVIMLIYIAIRFQFKFGLAAVIALLHDTLIMIGFVRLLNIEMDITVIAAILTILGYSINDTIVVFDRIRENSERISTNKDEYFAVVNRSIHQSLSRTLITSLTTLIVVLVLLIWGGEVIYNFSLLLLIGIVIGTYSSIFIASPALVLWDSFKERKDKKKKKKVTA